MTIRDDLQAAQTAAMRARDRVAVAALRSLRAALDNAEAVAAPAGAAVDGSADVAGAATGLGAAEVARRELTDADIARVLEAEIAERHDAATTLRESGAGDRADLVLAEAVVLERFRR